MTGRQTILIFDGPDGCGKTEIAKELSRRMSIPYFRFERQHDFFKTPGAFKQSLEFIEPWMTSFLRQTGHSVIMDRAYPSEWVYSKAYGRETNLEVLESVDRAFSEMGAWIIIPSRLDFSNVRADEVIEKEMLKKIDDLYREFMKWTKCQCIELFVDALGEDLDREIQTIYWDMWRRIGA